MEQDNVKYVEKDLVEDNQTPSRQRFEALFEDKNIMCRSSEFGKHYRCVHDWAHGPLSHIQPVCINRRPSSAFHKCFIAMWEQCKSGFYFGRDEGNPRMEFQFESYFCAYYSIYEWFEDGNWEKPVWCMGADKDDVVAYIFGVLDVMIRRFIIDYEYENEPIMLWRTHSLTSAYAQLKGYQTWGTNHQAVGYTEDDLPPITGCPCDMGFLGDVGEAHNYRRNVVCPCGSVGNHRCICRFKRINWKTYTGPLPMEDTSYLSDNRELESDLAHGQGRHLYFEVTNEGGGKSGVVVLEVTDMTNQLIITQLVMPTQSSGFLAAMEWMRKMEDTEQYDLSSLESAIDSDHNIVGISLNRWRDSELINKCIEKGTVRILYEGSMARIANHFVGGYHLEDTMVRSRYSLDFSYASQIPFKYWDNYRSYGRLTFNAHYSWMVDPNVYENASNSWMDTNYKYIEVSTPYILKPYFHEPITMMSPIEKIEFAYMLQSDVNFHYLDMNFLFANVYTNGDKLERWWNKFFDFGKQTKDSYPIEPYHPFGFPGSANEMTSVP